MDRRSGQVSSLVTELIKLETEMLGVVHLGQCGWDTPGPGDPFSLKDGSPGTATMPGTLGRILTLKIVWGWLIAPANCSAARVGTPAGYTFSSSIVSMLLTH